MASRAFGLLSFLLLAGLAPLTGCTSSGDGTFTLYASDVPDDLPDFMTLTVSVTKITLTSKDGKTSDYTPAKSTFDLTKLSGSNVTQLFSGPVAAGNYTRLVLAISNATGTLKDGKSADVKAPGGQLFVNAPFEIASGKETHFVFDVTVHMEGNGRYVFQPNATGSGPRAAKPANVV